jgi:hypothetical protein
MKIKILLYVSLMAISMTSIPIYLNAQVFVDAETGAVFTGYNNVRIPGDTGTKFSLKDDLTAEPGAFIRLRAGITLGSRHTISLLYAPLKVKSEGLSAMEINFNGVRFPVNTQLDATYKFNSYRITYRYDIVKRPKFEFGLGFTAKIRDAEIALSGAGMSSSKTNVGFVPIIHFRLYWKMYEKFGLLLEGDALGAPQGRAEDVLLAGTYSLSDHILLRIGYRILEGGADNDEVYNFALIHYASAGITYTF